MQSKHIRHYYERLIYHAGSRSQSAARRRGEKLRIINPCSFVRKESLRDQARRNRHGTVYPGNWQYSRRGNRSEQRGGGGEGGRGGGEFSSYDFRLTISDLRLRKEERCFDSTPLVEQPWAFLARGVSKPTATSKLLISSNVLFRSIGNRRESTPHLVVRRKLDWQSHLLWWFTTANPREPN